MWASRNIHHVDHGDQAAADALEAELRAICGNARQVSFAYSGTHNNVDATIHGTGDEVIVIGAHLDSTAAKEKGYVSATSDAPGIDDDWTGVAGVLIAAEQLKALADQQTPLRSIRFVLFNAEEEGMVGSFEYAKMLKEHEGVEEPYVAAMIMMDMIAWHGAGTAPFTVEIHSTGLTQYYRAKPQSDALAQTVVQAMGGLQPPANLTAQVYPLPGCATDPSFWRSDHSSFHYQDWAACLISEDMYADGCGPAAPVPPGNPGYHMYSDTEAGLFPDYAADIIRTVVAAAWMLAKP